MDVLADMDALAFLRGFPRKFGFIAWATETPFALFKVLARVFSFDGRTFTTAWAPKALISGTFRRSSRLRETDSIWILSIQAAPPVIYEAIQLLPAL
jgi:hypothetical protein